LQCFGKLWWWQADISLKRLIELGIVEHVSRNKYVLADTRERDIDISLPPSLINDGLPALIEHARNNQNEEGVYFDNAIEFRYDSRVNLEYKIH